MVLTTNGKEMLGKIERLIQVKDFVVAGGYARDLYFGRTPRDIDVWLHSEDFMQVWDNLQEQGLSKRCTLHCEYFTGTLDQIGRPVGEITQVIKVGCVDLIFVDHPIEEITETFDYNINQFELTKEGLPTFLGVPYTRLAQVSDYVRPERHSKMIKLHEELMKNV